LVLYNGRDMKTPAVKWPKIAANSVGAVLAGFLFACATPPKAAPKAALIPMPSIEKAVGSAKLDGVWPAQKWWESFNDPTLSGLIGRAVNDSPTVKLASAKILRAQGLYRVAQSFTSPEASAGARLTQNRISEHGLIPAKFVDSPYAQGDIFAGVSYDLDLWDRAGFAAHAAGREAQAAQAEADEARLILSHSVAMGYYSIASLRDSLAQVKSAQATQDELVKILESRMKAGLENETELDRARSVRAVMNDSEEALISEIRLTINAMAALIGAGPDELEGLDAVARMPSALTSAVPPDLSLNLLARRPDVRSALLRVSAASDRIGVARAGFYPDIRLSALAAFQSLDLIKLLDPASLLYSLGPAISLPLFNASRLEAGLDAANADYDMAVERYNQTALTAAKDAADQLTLVSSFNARVAALAVAYDEACKAERIAERRYTSGLEGKITPLRAALESFDRKRALITARRADVSARIGLIKALGGGLDYSAAAKSKE
jgi:NodT family efflux transporter outer membrane factor (OMF) lipoprotein